MPAEAEALKFEFDLGKYGGDISVASGEELVKWAQDEWKAWEWVAGTGQSQLEGIVQRHSQFRDHLQDYGRRWMSARNNPTSAQAVLANIENLFQEHYCKRRIFHNSSVEAAFLSKLRQ